MEKTLIKMVDINKSFPGVVALKDVKFDLREGEIHALLGENGAGKSTLIKVLTGVEAIDSGKMYFCDTLINPKNPQQAQKIGIATVYQEVNLCPNLSVSENLFVGREIKKHGIIDWKATHKRAKKLLSTFNIDIDVTKTLDNFSVAIQQMVAIARDVDISAKVLILDEPTSSLSNIEVNELFSIMNLLKNKGIGIVFVTHFLDQVYEISDRITVLRNGLYVGTYATAALPKIELVSKMIGKEYSDLNIQKKQDIKESKENVFLELKNASSQEIENINLKLCKGEITGFSGLLGSGRSEIARLIFACDKAIDGEIIIDDKQVKLKEPLDAIRKGIAFCSENRKTEGIVGDFSIKENIVLALQAKNGMFKKISNEEANKIADKYIKVLQIKTPSRDQKIKNLSGGNQQKVILARWLATNPNLIILDEPTRGIDIGTKAEIQKIVTDLANDGMSIVFISSEIDEMVRCCDNMIILRDKKQVTQLFGDEISDHSIMTVIAGGDNE